MILIADSGATKTDWRIINSQGEIQQAKTIGLSPYYQTFDSIAAELTQNLLPFVKEELKFIFTEQAAPGKNPVRLCGGDCRRFFQRLKPSK